MMNQFKNKNRHAVMGVGGLPPQPDIANQDAGTTFLIKGDQKMNLETLTAEYQKAASMLANTQDELDQKLAAMRTKNQNAINLAARTMASLRKQLVDYIETHADLFANKKTQTINGVKVGFRKQKGKVDFADEVKTIRTIKQRYDSAQAELLIRTTERIHKPAVYDLTAADLKALGITITDDSDVVVCRADGERIEELMDRVLAA